MTNSRCPSFRSARAGRRSGSSTGANTRTDTSPSRAIGSPTGVSSNMLSGFCPASVNRPETTRLVDVPISVTVPPRMAANDSGMRYREGESPLRSAQLVTCGTSIATIGVLLRKAEAPAVGTSSRASARRLVPAPPRARNERLNRARLLNRPRDDVQRGDRDRCRIGQASERLCGCNDAADKQRYHGSDHRDRRSHDVPRQDGNHPSQHGQRQPRFPRHHGHTDTISSNGRGDTMRCVAGELAGYLLPIIDGLHVVPDPAGGRC